MFYLPSLFHSLENQAKNTTDPLSDDQERPEREDNFISPHHSSSPSASEGEADGSLSITSNIRKLTNDKQRMLSEIKDAGSPTRNNSSEDLDRFTEEMDTFHSDDSPHTVNSKEVNVMISQIETDNMLPETRERKT